MSPDWVGDLLVGFLFGPMGVCVELRWFCFSYGLMDPCVWAQIYLVSGPLSFSELFFNIQCVLLALCVYLHICPPAYKQSPKFMEFVSYNP